MKGFVPTALAALLAALPNLSLADPAEAETLVRAGSPVRALQALDAADKSPAALFWRGRALIELGRYEEASYALEQVPKDDVLAPYAQRALIFCAWQCPLLDFPQMVAPLTESADPAVARLATAALAEYELRRKGGAAEAALRDMQRIAAISPEWSLASRLLEIEYLRQKKRFDDALTLCRLLEADKSLPTLARQRVRLALSELYYAKEAVQAEELSATAAPAPAGDDETEDDEGKGEETLLQFIAANPDSALLDEAFRRLAAHGAFRRGEYALGKLTEWSNDPTKPRRAALALRVRQLMQHRALREGQAPDAACVNLATSQLPREPMTAQMLREQVRVLVAQDRAPEAEVYLRMLPKGSAHALFYEGLASTGDYTAAFDAFQASALEADENLRPAALVNSLLAAHASGNAEEVAHIMDEDHPRSVRAALLAARAAYLMPRDAAAARRDLEAWLALYPESQAPVDALMDLAVLALDNEPDKAAEYLKRLDPKQKRQWNERQELRYYALLMEAVQRSGAPDAAAKALAIARRASNEGSRPAVRATMKLKLCSMLSAQKRHGEALALLERFAAQNAHRPEAARALIMAGHAAAAIGSLDSLKHAAELYERCAEMESPYAVRARLYRASVLSHIGRREDARALIDDVKRRSANGSAPMEPEDAALAACFLADTWSLEGTDEGLQNATLAMEEALADPQLPDAWRFRIRFQHAIFCSRQGRNKEALATYMEVIEDAAALGGVPSQADWFILYSAGAGGVSQHLELKQFKEAAALAERIANWRAGGHGASRPGGPSADKFAEWAAAIRRVHPSD